MSDKLENSNGNSVGLLQFLARVKDYKEFISILVFFSLGFYWMNDNFVTVEVVKLRHCQNEKRIDLISAKLEIMYLEDLIAKLDTNNETKNGVLNPDPEAARKMREKNILEEKLSRAHEKKDEANDFLNKSECGKTELKTDA